MNNKIQIKRSDGNTAPTGLMAGELAWSDNDATGTGAGGAVGFLYIGDVKTGGSVRRKIGGPGWGLELLDGTTLTTSSGGVSPNLDATVSQGDRSLKIATTEYVDIAVENAEPAMNDISDATMTNEADADLIVWNASASNPAGGTGMWENKPISGHVSLSANGNTVVTNVQDGAVTLGTQTQGAYVGTMTAGDNISITGQGGEDANVTVSLAEHVTIAGNLTVSGTTTTVESSTVSVTDPVFVVGGDVINDTTDRGISFKWNDDDSNANNGAGNTKEGFFGYDKTDGKFKYIKDASNNSEQFTGTLGDVAFGEINGKLVDGNQDNITQLGTITAGVWNSSTKIGQAYGGTNLDTSAGGANDAGVATVTGGTWSIDDNLAVGYGGTGLSTLESNALMVGNGAGAVTMISTTGHNGKLLRVEAGVPTWSDTLDAGTW